MKLKSFPRTPQLNNCKDPYVTYRWPTKVVLRDCPFNINVINIIAA